MKPSVLAGAIVAATLAMGVSADHSWGDYHWARSSNPFTLQILNSTTADWDSYVFEAEADWSTSQLLDMDDVASDDAIRTRKKCSAPTGKIRICNAAYGQNGWLGVAGISIDPRGHITKGYTKLNDTYFAWSYYNNDAWKQSVTCQELGHNLGLDHQDEDFDNTSLKSCMDYQDPPWPSPNAHDYEQLESIYAHTDTYDSWTAATGASAAAAGANASATGTAQREQGWGISLGRRGNHETFLRIDPDGTRHLTFVIWVEGA